MAANSFTVPSGFKYIFTDTAQARQHPENQVYLGSMYSHSRRFYQQMNLSLHFQMTLSLQNVITTHEIPY